MSNIAPQAPADSSQEDAAATSSQGINVAYPMENIRHPGMNDVMFGRGGDTNYHIGNHRFRVEANMYRDKYRAASRKDKSNVVWELVASWRSRNKPPGRFLRRTNPELGDESLWHDVGHDAAMKKAAKILSEKTPPSSKSREGASRKRQHFSSDGAEPPPKESRKDSCPLHVPADVPGTATEVLGAEIARLAHAFSANPAPPQVPISSPTATTTIQQQLLQFAAPSSSSSLNLRNSGAHNDHSASPPTTRPQDMLSTLVSSGELARSSAGTRSLILQALAAGNYPNPRTGGVDSQLALLLNTAMRGTSLANAPMSNQAVAQEMSQVALLQASKPVPPTVGDLELSAKLSLLAALTNAEAPAPTQGPVQAALLRSAQLENTSIAAAYMALMTQNSNGMNRAAPVATTTATSDLLARLRDRRSTESIRERNDTEERLCHLAISRFNTNGLRTAAALNQHAEARKLKALLLTQDMQTIRDATSSRQQRKGTKGSRSS